MIENISEDALLKTCDITKDEKCTVTLEFLIRDYAEHQLYHLESIKKNKMHRFKINSIQNFETTIIYCD